MPQPVIPTTPFSVTFPSLADAVGALVKATFKRDMVINPVFEPVTATSTDDLTADELRAERDNWAETAAHHLTEVKRLEAEATRLHAHWHEAATEVTRLRADLRDGVKGLTRQRDQLQKERDAFKALAEGLTKKPAPVPEYRLLDEGEILQEGDEFQGSFGWVMTRYLDQGVQPGWEGYYRRKITTI